VPLCVGAPATPGTTVPPVRLELTPRGLKGRRSNHLSYGGPCMLDAGGGAAE
jgi:hypothetical protein